MQAFDHENRLVVTETGSEEELKKKAELLKMRSDIKKVMMGNIVKFGQVIEIGGLQYKIKKEMSRNRFVIQLMEPD